MEPGFPIVPFSFVDLCQSSHPACSITLHPSKSAVATAHTPRNIHQLIQLGLVEAQYGTLNNTTNSKKYFFQWPSGYSTRVQAEVPDPQFNLPDTKEGRTLRICEIVAPLLLSSLTEPTASLHPQGLNLFSPTVNPVHCSKSSKETSQTIQSIFGGNRLMSR
jgi:hypothetical protein